MAKRKAAKSKAKGGKKPARTKAKKKSAKGKSERSVYDLPLPPRSQAPVPKQERAPVERELDKGLEDTFPASDPPAMTEPAPTPPDGNRKPN